MYNPDTNKWTPVKDLPVGLSSAKMELLAGRPTIIGGYILANPGADPVWSDPRNTQNGKLYQYFVEDDEWRPHEIEMRLPRTSAAVFQVPRHFFQC